MATAVRTKPILFSGPMVRAILDGKKTQTRRLLKPKCSIPAGKYEMRRDPMYGDWVMGPAGASLVSFMQAAHGWVTRDLGPLPYAVGDILYVRETWAHGDAWWENETWKNTYREGYGWTHVDYRASMSHADLMEFNDVGEPWRPSIHMPKWAARLWLEVTAVRVERLKEMRAADVVAEGFPFSSDLDQFKSLWDSLSKPGSQWADNPWVAVYEFRRRERNAG